jgi:poly(ADP-ribose) glycohydrolase ARH3
VRVAGDPQRLRAEATESARLTHAHPVGIDGAVVQAVAIAAALHGANALEAARRAAETADIADILRAAGELLGAAPDPVEVHALLGSSSDVARSVPAAIYAALAHPTFERAVAFAVRLGGDTDTVAAMTGAIAGALHGAASIPTRWLEALEDDERGRTHVEWLADELLA